MGAGPSKEFTAHHASIFLFNANHGEGRAMRPEGDHVAAILAGI
jgi:hypothetical protein